jgi:predicted Zn finger-like uncharacterized protein
MAIQTACPACRTSYRLADAMRSKQVRCRECHQPFTVGGPPPAPPARPTAPPAAGQVRVTCPGCRATYSLPASFRGKKGRCKKCQHAFAVPAAAPAAAPTPAPPASVPARVLTPRLPVVVARVLPRSAEAVPVPEEPEDDEDEPVVATLVSPGPSEGQPRPSARPPVLLFSIIGVMAAVLILDVVFGWKLFASWASWSREMPSVRPGR